MREKRANLRPGEQLEAVGQAGQVQTQILLQ